jgi:excisionase family DNA binding protein
MNSASSPENVRLLTEREAANLLSISSRTLQAWRSNGGGPTFVRVGRVIRYRRSDLIAWIEKNASVR